MRAAPKPRRPLVGRAAALAAASRKWSERELKEMRTLYIDKRIRAVTVARLFKTTIPQVYRLARIHGWPHRAGGPPADPKAVRRLRPKHRELYYHLRPTLGHDAALAEAWRGMPVANQGGQMEGART